MIFLIFREIIKEEERINKIARPISRLMSEMPLPNDDFFDNINRIAQQQIYKDASLNAYTSNDPIAVHNRLLVEIDSKKRDLKAEIAALRSLLK